MVGDKTSNGPRHPTLYIKILFIQNVLYILYRVIIMKYRWLACVAGRSTTELVVGEEGLGKWTGPPHTLGVVVANQP